MTGLHIDIVLGQTPALIRGERTIDYYTHQDMLAKLEAGEEWHGEIQARHSSGREIILETRTSPVKADPQDHTRTTHYVIIRRDITFRKQQEASLRKLSKAVEHSGSAIFITNKIGIIEYINQSFTVLTGLFASEAKGSKPWFIDDSLADTTEYQTIFATITRGEDYRGTFNNHKPNGTKYWASVSLSPITDPSNKITHYVGVCEDITEQHQSHLKMEQLALYDSLTGLENRRFFCDRFEQAILHVRRESNQAAVMFLDLDRFKRINDTLGHDAGDALLVIVAQRLKSCVRSTDTVARIGGDEFTVLLPQTDGVKAAVRVAEKIISVFNEPVDVGNGQCIVATTSIGIAMAPEDGVDAEELIKRADLAMYKAKKKGRNSYCFFDQSLIDDESNTLSEEVVTECDAGR
tara:strand:- start:291 stop:1511 length:1221 start_codon:yes stop_codon:yes gene_type:complete